MAISVPARYLALLQSLLNADKQMMSERGTAVSIILLRHSTQHGSSNGSALHRMVPMYRLQTSARSGIRWLG